jgi:thiol-disulfide isomerase/thioredoxin
MSGTGNRSRNLVIAAVSVLLIFFAGYAVTGYLTEGGPAAPDGPPVVGEITTFHDNGGDVCLEDGKPLVILFSTTWCPHCNWIKSTFDSVASEYADQGLIVARHWELDTNDDTLTPEVENSIPQRDLDIYNEFNPRGSIPTFVFGCKYYRIGNGHEAQNDLSAEAAEFRGVIEELLGRAS